MTELYGTSHFLGNLVMLAALFEYMWKYVVEKNWH